MRVADPLAFIHCRLVLLTKGADSPILISPRQTLPAQRSPSFDPAIEASEENFLSSRSFFVRVARSVPLPGLAIAALACAPSAQHAGVRPDEPARQSPEERPGPARPAAAWERAVEGSYENRGLARIEKVGNRWALTVLCNGTHTTYIDDTKLDLASHAGSYVNARYKYAERTIDDPKCFRAPCGPVHERRIALERLTAVAATPEAAREAARQCNPSPGPKREK
jgi:hypothetical protein